MAGTISSRKELSLAKQVMLETASPLEKLQKSTDVLTALQKKGLITQQQYNESLRRLKKNADTSVFSLGRMTKAIGAASVAFGGLGLSVASAGILMRSVFRSGETFARSMTRSLAIMGDVSASLRREMRQTAHEVARDTRFTGAQAGEAYFFLASAGLDAEKQLKSLPRVAKFAQAGNFDLALATDLVTDAQSAFGLASKDTATHVKNLNRVMDLFIGANQIANANAQQFSEALTGGAGVASQQLGQSLEETLAILQVFADKGFAKGTEAGTQFGIVMRELTNKSVINAAAFRKANIEVFDPTTGRFKGLISVTKDLERALGGLDLKSRTSFLLDLGFTAKSAKSLQALIGASEQAEEYRLKLIDLGGVVDEVANKQMTDLERASNDVKASWEELSVNATETLGPALSSVLDIIGFLIRDFQKFGGHVRTVGDDLTRTMTGIQNFGRGENPFAGTALEQDFLDLQESVRNRSGGGTETFPGGALEGPGLPPLVDRQEAQDIINKRQRSFREQRQRTPRTRGGDPFDLGPDINAIVSGGFSGGSRPVFGGATGGFAPVNPFGSVEESRGLKGAEDIFDAAEKMESETNRFEQQFAGAALQGSQEDIAIRAASRFQRGAVSEEEVHTGLFESMVTLLGSIDGKTEPVEVEEVSSLGAI